MRTLQHGSKGGTVRTLQEALVEVGYDLAVDGHFGDGTYNAVVDFQQNNELQVDGIVGEGTWAALGYESDDEGDDDESKSATGMPMISHGASGSAVRALQEALANQGYDLAVDGIFGDDTHGALEAFQESQGLAVDGIAGPATWGALGM